MYKELRDSLGCYIPNNGYLVKWAKQGVLLLNTALTVRKDTANSHRGKGWENFTSEVIRKLNGRQKPVIFLLWGSNAKEKAELIDKRVHHVLTSVHPSPLSASRGFFGCNHFKKANEILIGMNETPIDWQIENI
jgi:uracil-DNA glycosylase